MRLDIVLVISFVALMFASIIFIQISLGSKGKDLSTNYTSWWDVTNSGTWMGFGIETELVHNHTKKCYPASAVENAGHEGCFCFEVYRDCGTLKTFGSKMFENKTVYDYYQSKCQVGDLFMLGCCSLINYTSYKTKC